MDASGRMNIDASGRMNMDASGRMNTDASGRRLQRLRQIKDGASAGL